jgi:MerR family transcriptional regulator, redox-sensitive transcriptional activator SoxR
VTELLTIGEVAARAGIRASALRYYEEEGLLEPAARVGGQRRYTLAALDKLTVIRFCQALGFSLAEVRELLTPPRGSAQKERWRGLVDAKVEELDAVLKRTRAMRKILRVSRDCDCVDLEECAAACGPSLPEGPA